MEKPGIISRSGRIVDVRSGRIFLGTVTISGGHIREVREEAVTSGVYILPGLIDAHVHIESSMLIPSEFARLAVMHGTVATVSDPHEIANVMGIKGIEFMIRNGNKVPFKFYFGAPSCVPATGFETAGAVLGLKETESLLSRPEIRYLSEMMNFPGVLERDPEVMGKLELARKYGKPVDGHAPGLKGEKARRYASAGITTDHECFSLEEALDKIRYGMKILIREGSAAKNFDALAGLLAAHPDKVMFCSDDKHPDDLLRRHIDDLARRAIASGYDPVSVIRACTLNPVTHYGLDTGLLRPGDPADFIVIDSLESFKVLETYIDGNLVAKEGVSLIGQVREQPVNHFGANKIRPGDLEFPPGTGKVRVIEALEGQLITRAKVVPLKNRGDLDRMIGKDILKIVVMNRYQPAPPAIGLVTGFGITHGAIASSVAHDSHNLIATGSDDESIVSALNALVDSKGGICVASPDGVHLLPLPVGGIMSDDDGFRVARSYESLNLAAKSIGSRMEAPFMTLSFMALLVIPELKLSDKGLFDGNSFQFVPIYIE